MSYTLITGGTGFIGSHIAARLLKDGDVTLFDNLRRNSVARMDSDHLIHDAKIVEGDVLDRDALRSAMEGAHTVIHLAAIVGVTSYYAQSVDTLNINLLGTMNAVELAVEANVNKFVFFSTSEVYGAQASHVNEMAPCAVGPPSNRRWVYATSKLAGEHAVLRTGEVTDMNVSVVRPFNAYGPGQTGEGAIANFCRKIAAGEPMEIYGDGQAVRTYCYISDIVDAVETIIKKPETDGNIYNVGNPDSPVTTEELAARMQGHAPQSTVKFKAVDRDEVFTRIPNIDKARTELGFEPKVNLEEGLGLTLADYGV